MPNSPSVARAPTQPEGARKDLARRSLSTSPSAERGEPGPAEVVCIDADEAETESVDIEEVWGGGAQAAGRDSLKRQYRPSVSTTSGEPYIDLCASPSPKGAARKTRTLPPASSAAASSAAASSAAASSAADSSAAASSSSSGAPGLSARSSSSRKAAAGAGGGTSPGASSAAAASPSQADFPSATEREAREKRNPNFSRRGGEVPGASWLERELCVAVWDAPGTKRGYLYNIVQMQAEIATSEEKKETVSGLHLYFVSETGATWRTSLLHRPYFYLSLHRTRGSYFEQLKEALLDLLGEANVRFEKTLREDLSDPAHLAPLHPSWRKDGANRTSSFREFIKVSFANVKQLVSARDELRKIVRQNREACERRREEERLASFAEKTKAKTSAFSRTLRSPFASPDAANFSDLAFIQGASGDGGDKGGSDGQREGRDEARGGCGGKKSRQEQGADVTALIEDIFEADVLYVTRCCIDLKLRCGLWHDVQRTSSALASAVLLTPLPECATAPPLRVLAWDIECSKQPLKFPDSNSDHVILISYMFNGQGYLIVNRQWLSEDIHPFEFRAKKNMEGAGRFIIFNEKGEKELLARFVQHVLKLRPHILATYNGDTFDFPFVYRRGEINGLDFNTSFGITPFTSDSSYQGNSALIHIDCFKWVERDSYLPQGSRTLKLVCKEKLRFNPVEVDPEDMVPLALHRPQELAVYSVSDAVATFFLYEKYIHNFILALCTIIPMNPESVLRQGSGTLCEQLLMAEAAGRGVLFPNKHQTRYLQYWRDEKTRKMHLILEDSYVGGRVESLKCGIFRNDLEETFTLDSDAYQALIDSLDETLLFWLQQENGSAASAPLTPADFSDWEEHRNDMLERLTSLRNSRVLRSLPVLYHLDVSAMYPNIILTHRLQPPAVVDEDYCSQCPFSKEASLCQRRMTWTRKLEVSPAEKGHILPLQQKLQMKLFNVCTAPDLRGKKSSLATAAQARAAQEESEDSEAEEDDEEGGTKKRGRGGRDGFAREEDRQDAKSTKKSWTELTEKQKHMELVKVVKDFSVKAYKKTKMQKEVDQHAIVCQRENPFYVDTVRAFRDRRYIFKRRLKAAERLREKLEKDGGSFQAKKDADDTILLNDSLQLAHKCILNSFYGYVKRDAARWYSMQMGAVVTKAGADIIQGAKRMIDGLGVTMELDTDGIWCMLPQKFPQKYVFHQKETGKELRFEFPTTMLNQDVHRRYTNDQYLDYDEATQTFKRRICNEVYFELDGPWRAMFLPASEKSDDLLKKRYVIFAQDGSISELKGFEVKRRGELQIIKLFQTEVFPKLIEGKTKEEAYRAAAAVAYRYRELLTSRGVSVQDDEDLEELIVTKKVLAKPVVSQGLGKSTSITTAKRLAELLRNETYLTEAPVSTQYIVVSRPVGVEKTARAVPVQLFHADPETKAFYYQKWLGLLASSFAPAADGDAGDAAAAETTPKKLARGAAQASANRTLAAIDIRQLIDWDYYAERLDVQFQKILCIPAMRQGLPNPIPEVAVPEWLKKQQAANNPLQSKMEHFFRKKKTDEVAKFAPEPRDASQAEGTLFGQEDDEPTPVAVEDAAAGSREEDAQDVVRREEDKAKEAFCAERERAAKQRQEEKRLWSTDVVSWILAQKKNWKQQRDQLRQARARALSAVQRLPPGTSRAALIAHVGVSKLMKHWGLSLHDVALLLTQPWHLLDFAVDAKDPGLFYCRVATDASRVFYTIPVQVYRQVYLNTKRDIRERLRDSDILSPEADIALKPLRGVYSLPRGMKQQQLLEMTLPESLFQSEKEKLPSLFYSDTAAIYETEIPLDFQFLSKVGNTMVVGSTNLEEALRPTDGRFFSPSLSRFSSSSRSSFSSGATSSAYLSAVSPILVHVFHHKAPGAEAIDRIFVAVYEPRQSCAFFVGGALKEGNVARADPVAAMDEFVSALRRALRRRRERAAESGEEAPAAEDMEGDGEEDAQPAHSQSVADKARASQRGEPAEDCGDIDGLETLEPRDLETFAATFARLRQPTVHLGSSATSQRSVAAVLRDLEAALRERHYRSAASASAPSAAARNSRASAPKPLVYLCSTLDAEELGAWALPTHALGPSSHGPGGERLSVVHCKGLDRRFSRIKRSNFAEDCLRESLALLFWQHRVFEESLWVSRLFSFPLGNLLALATPRRTSPASPLFFSSAAAQPASAPHTRLLYDLHFAQLLRERKGILWGGRPDVMHAVPGAHAEPAAGPAEARDGARGLNLERDVDLGNARLSALNHADHDLAASIEPIVEPGIYRSVCFEILLNDALIFNSVRLCDKIDPEYTTASDWLNRESSALNAARRENLLKSENDEGATNGEKAEDGVDAEMKEFDANGPDDGLADFHSTTQFHPAAFRTLGRSLEALYKDLSSLRGRVAYPSVVRHLVALPNFFYAWVCSQEALLFDPALHQKVLRYCTVYFSLFLTELSERRNLTVVFANPRRLLVATPHVLLSEGEKHLTSVILHLNRSPLFDALPVTVSSAFLAVAQLDASSWIGYKEIFGEAEEAQDVRGDTESQGSPQRQPWRKEIAELLARRGSADESPVARRRGSQAANGDASDLDEEEEEQEEEDAESVGLPAAATPVEDHLVFFCCLPVPIRRFLRALLDRIVLSPLQSFYRKIFEDEDDLAPSAEAANCDALGNQVPLALLNMTPEETKKEIHTFVAALWFTPSDILLTHDEDEMDAADEDEARGRAHGEKRAKKKIHFLMKALQEGKKLTLFSHILLCLEDPRFMLQQYGRVDAMGDLSFKQLEFPNRLGSRLRHTGGNWRLEAVKVLVRLLAVDRAIDFTADNWAQAFDERRHELFELAGESEFSHLGWRSPLKSLALRDVECGACHTVANLDLLLCIREDQEILENGEVVEFKTCNCPRCGEAFPDPVIEAHLYRAVGAKYYAYAAQDHPCSACNAVNALYRRSKCRCGKSLKPRLRAEDWEEFIESVQEFAVEMGYAKLQYRLAALQQACLLLGDSAA